MFCDILIVSGSLLYNWHVRHTTEVEFQRSDRFFHRKVNFGMLPILNFNLSFKGILLWVVILLNLRVEIKRQNL